MQTIPLKSRQHSLDNHSLNRNDVYGLGSVWDCPPLAGHLCFHDPAGYEMMSSYSPHQGQPKHTFVLSEANILVRLIKKHILYNDGYGNVCNLVTDYMQLEHLRVVFRPNTGQILKA